MNSIDLTISIVSYDTEDLLKACLNSIYENTEGINYEIIVVDNNSSDGSVNMVKEEFPRVRLIVNKENVGFAKANNQVIKQSKGRYVLLLNSDTVVISDAVAKMVNFMDAHPEAGVVGCTKLNPDLSVQPSVTLLPNTWTVFLRFFRFKWLLLSAKQRRFVNRFFGPILGKTMGSYLSWYSDDKRKEARSVDFVTGTCFLIRHATIDDVGLLDESFFMYLEDADWCFRIKRKGWGIYIYPEAQIIHYVGESFRSTLDTFSLEHCRSRYYYFEKHHGRIVTFLLRVIIIFALILREEKSFFLYLFSGKKEREVLRKKIFSHFEIIKLSVNI